MSFEERCPCLGGSLIRCSTVASSPGHLKLILASRSIFMHGGLMSVYVMRKSEWKYGLVLIRTRHQLHAECRVMELHLRHSKFRLYIILLSSLPSSSLTHSFSVFISLSPFLAQRRAAQSHVCPRDEGLEQGGLWLEVCPHPPFHWYPLAWGRARDTLPHGVTTPPPFSL